MVHGAIATLWGDRMDSPLAILGKLPVAPGGYACMGGGALRCY